MLQMTTPWYLVGQRCSRNTSNQCVQDQDTRVLRSSECNSKTFAIDICIGFAKNKQTHRRVCTIHQHLLQIAATYFYTHTVQPQRAGGTLRGTTRLAHTNTNTMPCWHCQRLPKQTFENALSNNTTWFLSTDQSLSKSIKSIKVYQSLSKSIKSINSRTLVCSPSCAQGLTKKKGGGGHV